MAGKMGKKVMEFDVKAMNETLSLWQYKFSQPSR
jgi:hypothetical protein